MYGNLKKNFQITITREYTHTLQAYVISETNQKVWNSDFVYNMNIQKTKGCLLKSPMHF